MPPNEFRPPAANRGADEKRPIKELSSATLPPGADALDFASRLGSLLDAPLISCAPARKSEFRYPQGERHKLSSANNPSQLARWKPGWAIMARMGGSVALVDVDPRNGGDPEKVRQMLDGLGVRIYANVKTPGTGRHFYVGGHEELADAHNLQGWPGVDIQSFGGLVFLPGTQRPKYGGAGYEIAFDNLDALADGGDPDGGAALAGWVAEHRGSREEFEPSPPWDGKPLDRRQIAYLDATLKGMHSELAAMGKDSGRNTAVYNKAMAVGNYIAGAGLDEASAVAMLLDASKRNGLAAEDGEDAVLASIRSGIRNGKTSPRAVPPKPLGDEPPPDPPEQGQPNEAARRIRLTPASAIKLRPVRWVWADRIPTGELTLTPGHGGIGKSTFHVWVIAKLTRGALPGVHYGQPRQCIIAAEEDSWERTIAPRLVAAGADMDLAYRVDVVTETDEVVSISLPRDVNALTLEIARLGVALLSVDPVMSVLSSSLDSHKDHEVRLGLQPLARLADRTGCAVLGNAHFNKSTGSDPMSLIMGSAAFGNVARAALGFARDPEDEDGASVISQVKNNLGRLDLPSLRYRIDSATVETDDEGPTEVGRLVMLGETARSVTDILRERGKRTTPEDRSDLDEAADWIVMFLTEVVGRGYAPATEVIAAGEAAGFAKHTLQRARKKRGIRTSKADFGGGWVWALPEDDEDDEGDEDNSSPDGSSWEAETLIDVIDATLRESGTEGDLVGESSSSSSSSPSPPSRETVPEACQALTWRVCKNPNCQLLGGCVLADAGTTTEGDDL